MHLAHLTLPLPPRSLVTSSKALTLSVCTMSMVAPALCAARSLLLQNLPLVGCRLVSKVAPVLSSIHAARRYQPRPLQESSRTTVAWTASMRTMLNSCSVRLPPHQRPRPRSRERGRRVGTRVIRIHPPVLASCQLVPTSRTPHQHLPHLPKALRSCDLSYGTQVMTVARSCLGSSSRSTVRRWRTRMWSV